MLWSWAGPSESSEMRQGIDLHVDLSLGTGLLGKGPALGKEAPFGQGQWLGRISAASPCAAGDLVV